MKSLFIKSTCFFFFLLSFSFLYGQAPKSFSYQTVIRDASWNPLVNQAVGVQVSILEGTATGTVVYQENHAASTSQIGLVNLAIGSGNISLGVFDSINWGANSHFIQIDIDVTGGSNYITMGTTQLRSVPYALFAEKSNTPGPQGPTGTQGPQGNPGSNGQSAYDIWIANGNTGTQQDFLDSLQGTQGPQGPQGATGPSFFSKMEGGKVDIGSEVGLGIKIIAVSFSSPFSSPPFVLCTASAQPGTIFDDSFNITTRSITNTGFEMIINRVDSHSWSQDLDAHWMAFEY